MKKWFKFILFSLLSVFTICLYAGCSSDGSETKPQSVVSITLNCTANELNVGDSFLLTATVTNSTETPIFSSSDEKVAIVDENGNVKAMSVGKASIRVAVNSAAATCEVTVYNPSVPVLKLNLASNYMYVVYTRTLLATVKQNNVIITDCEISYESDNQEVASIDSNGVISGLGKGNCNITVKAVVGETVLTESISIQVKEFVVLELPQTITLTDSGEASSCSAEYPFYRNGELVENPEISWSVENTDVAVYDETENKFTAIAIGETQATAVYEDIEWTVPIEVVEYVAPNAYLSFTETNYQERVNVSLLYPYDNGGAYSGSVVSSYFAGTLDGKTGDFIKIEHQQSSMHYSHGPKFAITGNRRIVDLMDAGYTHITLNLYIECSSSRNIYLGEPTSATAVCLGKAVPNSWFEIQIDLKTVKSYVDANGTLNICIHNGGGSVGHVTMTAYMSELYALTIPENEFIAFDNAGKLANYVTSAPLWPSTSHTGSVTQSYYTGEVGGVSGNYMKLEQEQSSMHYSVGPQIKISSIKTAQELLDKGYTHIVVKIYYEGGASGALKLYEDNNGSTQLATLERNAWTEVKIDLERVKTFMETNDTYNIMINNGGGSVGYAAMTLYMSSIYAVTE